MKKREKNVSVSYSIDAQIGCGIYPGVIYKEEITISIVSYAIPNQKKYSGNIKKLKKFIEEKF